MPLSSRPAKAWKKPEIYFRNNSASTLTLLEAMLATGVNRLVFSSTAAVYGEPESTPIREDAPLRPTNAYGESKLLVEQMLDWLNRIHGFRYASLRYFNVAGAIEGRGEAHEPESHIIPLILDVALGRRQSIKVFGTGLPDAGRHLHSRLHPCAGSGSRPSAGLRRAGDRDRLIYNIGNGVGFTVREVIESARRVTGHPIPVENSRAVPAIRPCSSPVRKRSASELGWKPEYTNLDAIVASAWKWHQQRYQRTA